MDTVSKESSLKFLLKVVVLIAILLVSRVHLFGQCATSTDGQNLIVNGDFEDGVVGFTSGYTQHCLCSGCSGREAEITGYSNSGEYCVANDVHLDFHCCLPADKPFNAVPTAFTDHTSGTGNAAKDNGNNALLVDGACTAGIPIWSQVVTVQSFTNYYFTAWVTSLYTTSNFADLRFMINGVQQGTTITGPNNSSTWLSYTQIWSSGATGGPITISIVNNNTNCAAGNDFAIDDIAFTPGCAFGAPGPVPSINSGAASATLCGGGGLLNSGVSGATKEFIWKKNGMVISGATTGTYNATTVGTYEVCVRETSPPSCYRSDDIVVTNTYSVNLGSDLTLCNPPSVTLDALHQGTGVTYTWERNGIVIPGATSRTYLVSQAGTYKVTVTDPICGVKTDEVIITSNNTAIPNDKFFCPNASVNLSVTGSGKYKWWTAPSGGTKVSVGPNFSTPVLSASTTYYVEDTTTISYFVGPDRGDIGGGIGSNEDRRDNGYGSGNSGDFYEEFETFKPNITINSVIVYAYCNAFPNCSGQVRVSIYNTSNTLVYQSAPYAFSNITQNAYTQLTVPVNITITTPGIYRASIDGSSTGTISYLMKTNMAPAACNYDAFNVPGAFQFKTVTPTWMTCPFGYFFKWNISAPGDCGRVPVQAIADCSLPVELISFTAKRYDAKKVKLDWATSSEINNDYFSIERRFENETIISSIANVKAKGGVGITTGYSILDHVSDNRLILYRLKQIDLDGKIAHSDWISVGAESDYKLTVFPNPANESITLNAQIGDLKEYSISIHNVLGEIVFKETGNSTSLGQLNKTIDIKDLPPAIYSVIIITEENSWIERFVKK